MTYYYIRTSLYKHEIYVIRVGVGLQLDIDLIFSVYIDMGTGASDTVNLNLDFQDAQTVNNARFFEIKVTQLPCSSEYG